MAAPADGRGLAERAPGRFLPLEGKEQVAPYLTAPPPQFPPQASGLSATAGQSAEGQGGY